MSEKGGFRVSKEAQIYPRDKSQFFWLRYIPKPGGRRARIPLRTNDAALAERRGKLLVIDLTRITDERNVEGVSAESPIISLTRATKRLAHELPDEWFSSGVASISRMKAEPAVKAQFLLGAKTPAVERLVRTFLAFATPDPMVWSVEAAYRVEFRTEPREPEYERGAVIFPIWQSQDGKPAIPLKLFDVEGAGRHRSKRPGRTPNKAGEPDRLSSSGSPRLATGPEGPDFPLAWRAEMLYAILRQLRPLTDSERAALRKANVAREPTETWAYALTHERMLQLIAELHRHAPEALLVIKDMFARLEALQGPQYPGT